MTATDDVKASLKSTLEASLGEARDLLSRVSTALASVEATDAEWGALFKQFEAASAKIPIRPYNRMYRHDFKPASEPLFVGMDSEINERHYGSITDEYVAELIATYQQPTIDALTSVFDDVTGFFRQTASRVLTLRFFTNSDVLLKRFEAVVSPPWAQPIQRFSMRGKFALPYWIGTPVPENLPHRELFSIRDAQRGTLRIHKQKLQELVATLETAINELPFAEKLTTPTPVPQTLFDYSTHIGEGASVDGSAVGPGASNKTDK